MSGRQAAAALAAPGGNDGAAGARPHPQTKAMGTATTPIARLECALGHGKTPTIFGVLNNQVRCSRGTHHRRSGQVAAVAASDLLTVRGTAKPVKPARTWGDCGIVGADVQSTRRTSWRISATRLRREAAIANVPVRLTVSGSRRSWQRSVASLMPGGTVVGVTDRRRFYAQSVDNCVEAREVAFLRATTPQRDSADNRGFLLHASGSGAAARRAAEYA